MTTDLNRSTPLMLAIAGSGTESAIIDIIARLIRSGANVNAEDASGRVPIMYAAADGGLQVIQYLLEQPSVDRNVRDRFGKTPVFHFVARNREIADDHDESIRILRVLFKCNSSLRILHEHNTLLMEVAMAGNSHFVYEFLATDCENYSDIKDSINVVNDREETALMLAARSGSLPTVTELLSAPNIHV